MVHSNHAKPPDIDTIPYGVHPGQIVRACLRTAHLTQATAADLIGISRRTLNRIIAGHLRVTAQTAPALGALLSSGPRYWMQLQLNNDLWRQEHRARRGHQSGGGG